MAITKFQRWLQKHSNQLTAISAGLIAVAYAAKWGFNWLGVYDGAMIIASLLGGVPIAMRAWSALRAKVVSIELLVTIAVIGAFVIGEFNESAIVTFLFQFGTFLEQKTLAKTRASIKGLTEMAPQTAQVEQDDGTVEEEDVDDVEKGDHVIVKTGAAIPVDGVVVDGTGYVDEAAITGESRAVAKQKGAQVYAGTNLHDGFLKVEATKVGDDTTFGKIIELVEDAQDAKSPAEQFIDKFAKYYTPAVLVIALLVFIFSRDFKLAITVLVLGCPGALVIGAPVSNVAGIGNGAKRGVLMKGGNVMDAFAKVDTFVFDKTGTLTEGKTAVQDVTYYQQDRDQALKLGAAIEQLSDHPLGRAMITYAQQHDAAGDMPASDTQTLRGAGITATIDQHEVCAGNLKLLNAHHVELSAQQQHDVDAAQKQGNSIVLLAIDGHVAALFAIGDVIRPEAKEALVQLRKAGAKQLVMLTGDNVQTAQAVANELGLDTVHAELLPEQKVEFVSKLQAAGHHVAFVGDGINDSPALATADIGIGMGSGTDAAIETSDVVLIQANFDSLVHAYRLAKKTTLNTRENIVIAVAVVVFLLLGLVGGVIYMASGMFVHEVSILVVIFNAMRLINFGGKPTTESKKKPQLHENLI